VTVENTAGASHQPVQAMFMLLLSTPGYSSR
jgi:hypothetical protein